MDDLKKQVQAIEHAVTELRQKRAVDPKKLERMLSELLDLMRTAAAQPQTE